MSALIVDRVESGAMPPFPAGETAECPNPWDFQHDPRLSDDEVATLQRLQPEERAYVVQNLERFAKMPAARQSRLRAAWERFETMPETEQERLRRNYEVLLRLPERRREELIGKAQRWEELSPAQREALRQQLSGRR